MPKLDEQKLKDQTIVLFRLSALGDICLSTGLIAYLNRVYNCSFIVITKKSFSPILEQHPAIKHIIALDKNELKIQPYLAICKSLAQEYSNSILLDLHSNMRSKILSFFWKNKVYTYPKYKFSRWLFLHFRTRQAKAKLLEHNVLERYSLALFAKKIPRLEMPTQLYLSQEEKDLAQAKIQTIYAEQKKLVILHPYASYSSKNWLTENWQALYDLLLEAQINFIIVGQNNLSTKNAEDSQNQAIYDLTNQTSLRMTMALIEAAQVFVSSDSGPMHLATALQTKLIALFGPTTEEWGFYPSANSLVGQKIFASSLACRPCSLHGSKPCSRGDFACHKAISVQAVFEEIQKSLA